MINASRAPILIASFLWGLLGFTAFASDIPSSASLVAKHLDAIGSADVRATNTLRSGSGTVTLDLLTGGMGRMSGTCSVASMGKQFNFLMYFNAPNYIGDNFKFDGQKTFIADNDQSKFRRHNLSFFMYEHDVILKEGLWGGVWNAGWPLYDLQARQAKLKPEGTKNEDGKKLLRYRYILHHAEQELTVHLLFDPDTFRHVETIYEVTGPSGNIPMVTISEQFGDFRDEEGLVLPHSWIIRLEPDQAQANAVYAGQFSSMVWKLDVATVKVEHAPQTKAAPKK